MGPATLTGPGQIVLTAIEVIWSITESIAICVAATFRGRIKVAVVVASIRRSPVEDVANATQDTNPDRVIDEVVIVYGIVIGPGEGQSTAGVIRDGVAGRDELVQDLTKT